jgi:hypothetical protein
MSLLMRLIYHDIESKNQISRFDKALLQVATKAPILRLASPYIGLSYLMRITEESSDWLLLSDIEAWLQSANRKNRVRCWEFIANNLNRIRHIPNLHAKVAIGNNLLFLGSANLTNTGIQSRTELSVLIEEVAIVNEAISWFDDLWKTAAPPVIEEGDALVSALNEFEWTTPRSRVNLSTSAPKVYGILVDTKRLTQGLDVAKVMAEVGLEEAKASQPLYTEYEKITQQLVINKSTFTFNEILKTLKETCGQVSPRGLLAIITKHTVNHIAGGYDIEGYDRFIFEKNCFKPWDESGLKKVQDLDNILTFIIKSLKFNEPNYLPLEDKWLNIGVPAHKILTIVDQLILAGLLLEVDEAGDIEQYSIETNFEWPRRWRKFLKAHDLFDKNLSALSNIEKAMKSDELDKDGELFSIDNDRKNAGADFAKDPFYLKIIIKEELEKEASRQKINPKELAASHDDILSTTLEHIKIKGFITLDELNEMVEILKKYNFPRKIIKELINKNNGAFRANFKNQYIPSRAWEYAAYMHFYKKSLKIWTSIPSI